MRAWRYAWTKNALKLVQWMQASAEYHKGRKEAPRGKTKWDVKTTCRKQTRRLD